MKKYLPILFLSLIAFVSQGQSLTISFADGTDVSNDTAFFDIHPSSGTFNYNFVVENVSDNDLMVDAVRYENECMTGSAEYYCWTLCLGAENCGVSYERGMPYGLGVLANTVSGPPLAVDFDPNHDSDEDAIEGTAIYTYVLWDENNPNDSVYVVVVYNVDYAVGINEFDNNALSQVYPNPSNDVISITMNQNIDNAQFEIYSLVGTKVFTEELSNVNGKVMIDVSTLSPGIYLLQERQSQLTRKFIISR